MCDKYSGKIINIHHSFLPSFAGSNPYKRAAQRGVKLIGATCHYVTSELDEGPIIEQDVLRVSHSDSVQEMQKMGQDIEKVTLAKGLQYHLEDRVLTCNNKQLCLVSQKKLTDILLRYQYQVLLTVFIKNWCKYA
ncbi:Formyltetrahydrofolate deformylase (EC [uncultured Gammaproteobacteria bacterium]|nr:Formyltetrahydrofolate deformylase (EC [uncultured Gammaproteobacteria bacterium]